jgi:retinol dehydrogenase-12
MPSLSTFRDFIYHQLLTRLPYPETDFSGKTVIVTGANIGLGLEAARHFSRLNAKRVILAVRSASKGEAAKQDIEASTKKNNVEVWELDLSS